MRRHRRLVLASAALVALASALACNRPEGTPAPAAGATRPTELPPDAGIPPSPPDEDVRVKDDDRIVVVLEPLASSTTTGQAVFTKEAGGVALEVELRHAPPGPHAVHLHENPDCSAPDGSSAGAHWNPTAQQHGQWGQGAFHLGDIGNVEVGADGTGVHRMISHLWTMRSGETSDVVGRSVIIHAAVDDFKTQPTGAAGGRIACGVIR